MFVKINFTLVKKQKHPLQISVRELHNDMILPSYEEGFCGTIKLDGKKCIGDMSLRNYMPKYIKPISNINNITCELKTWISAMLIK